MTWCVLIRVRRGQANPAVRTAGYDEGRDHPNHKTIGEKPNVSVPETIEIFLNDLLSPRSRYRSELNRALERLTFEPKQFNAEGGKELLDVSTRLLL